MTYRIIKYGLLTAPVLIILYMNLPIGDYTSGIVQIFMMLALSALLILSFIVFTIIDITRTLRKKVRFDFIPLAILALFCSTFFLDSDKFWTKRILTGKTEKGDLRSAEICLYRNNTFAVTISYVEWANIYQGDYTIINDTLLLKREELPELTNQVFGTRYIISQTDSLLIPIDKKHPRIIIKK